MYHLKLAILVGRTQRRYIVFMSVTTALLCLPEDLESLYYPTNGSEHGKMYRFNGRLRDRKHLPTGLEASELFSKGVAGSPVFYCVVMEKWRTILRCFSFCHYAIDSVLSSKASSTGSAESRTDSLVILPAQYLVFNVGDRAYSS